LAREWTNGRESLEGCPPWQPQIQARRRRCEKIHPLTEPQSTRRRKTGNQILAREWTRILANPWRAVLRGSPRFRRAGAVTTKYILSRSHEAHEGGKPEIRFWPANGRKSSRTLGGLSSVAAQDPGAQAPLRKNTSSHGAAKHTEGENRKADFGPRMDANPRESLEGCPPWQPQIQARTHRYEKIHLTEPRSTRRGKTGKQILARDANTRGRQRD
jgi:hypothetical protein